MTQLPSTNRIASTFEESDRNRLLRRLVLIGAVFVLIAGYGLANYQAAIDGPLRRTPYPSQWICAAGNHSHAGYLRKRFDLQGNVKHAWIKIAAADAFEISVNRNPLGRIYLWRPTRPFQNGTSEKGQVLLPQSPGLALNFPREYQWNGHDTWRVPSYIELTSALRQGKNVITIELESRLAPARASFTGEIVLHSGEVIPINSDESWLAEPAVPGPQLLDWTEVYYWDKQWRHAQVTNGPAASGYRSHPEEIFTRPFAGKWMRHPSAANRAEITYRANWEVDAPIADSIDEAWLRLLTNRPYELRINGKLARVASNNTNRIDSGEWQFDSRLAVDPTSKPELLDPDEVGSLFVGTRFESPRKGHRNLGEFRQPFSPKLTPFRYIRTYNRAQDPGVWDPKRTLAESRRTPETPDLFPDSPRPNSLKHDLSKGGYASYSIAPLLMPGKNQIEVRCLENSNANWPTQIAIDGGLTTKNKRSIPLVAEGKWLAASNHVVSKDPSAVATNEFQPVRVVGTASVSGAALPMMKYRSNVIVPDAFRQYLINAWLQIFIATIGVVALGLCFATAFKNAYGPAMRAISAFLLTASVVILNGAMLQWAWTERHEILWFLDGSMWRIIFAAAFCAAVFVAGLPALRTGLETIRSALSSWKQNKNADGKIEQGLLPSSPGRNRIGKLPESKIWFHLCIWVLLLGALLRGYKLDLQPLDDDEYASTQAILAILETGVPQFVAENVYYTRSPLFHYLTAAVAWPFGGDLWSLRLQSVFWSIATAWLAYLCGAKLLGSRWVGFLTMLLLCVHPFQIFTGHIIRFYQMQQFFALLTVYFFCRGFVSDQRQRYRVGALLAFLATVLSQEISVVLGPALVLGYVMFGRGLGWRKNVTLVLLSVSIMAIIAVDFIVFQNLCLTRTEGVSPTIQAAVKPHFWYPMNFLSLFIGYSRLHIVPSLFLLGGLPLLCRRSSQNAIAMLWFLISGIVLTNVLVTNVSLRYMYWLFPIWMLLCVEALRHIVVAVSQYDWKSHDFWLKQNPMSVCFGAVCVVCILSSWSLWRIPGSYELRILGDSTGAVRWVRTQKRPGDLVGITEPHTHCAFIESGKCDYDIAVPLLYDFAVMQDGILVDRNGGGEVVSSVDQLIEKISRGKRVWILLNREKFRSRGKNMRWEYPGARFETFIRKNFELKHRTYLWSVYLWDPARGHYQPFRLQQ